MKTKEHNKGDSLPISKKAIATFAKSRYPYNVKEFMDVMVSLELALINAKQKNDLLHKKNLELLNYKSKHERKKRIDHEQ